MSEGTPARDFLLPRLRRLLADAAGAGISREVAVAVLIDLVTGPGFNDVPLSPDDEAPADNTGATPIGVHEVAVAEGEAVPMDGMIGGGPLRGRIGRRGTPRLD